MHCKIWKVVFKQKKNFSLSASGKNWQINASGLTENAGRKNAGRKMTDQFSQVSYV